MHSASFPPSLHALAIGSLAIAVTCAIVIALEEIRRPQQMGVMNLVWPLTALVGSLLWLCVYYRWGRSSGDRDRDMKQKPPFPVVVLTGASHCGAGCTLGDIVAEWLGFAVPMVAVWFGWHSLFTEKTFAIWILDLLLAFLFGVAFQYFTIKRMRNVSVGQGIVQALKADIASIAAWQVGMYGIMALIQFGWFWSSFGGLAPVDSPEFWFAMQIAMLAGFCTSYPINWWLIRAGAKEKI